LYLERNGPGAGANFAVQVTSEYVDFGTSIATRSE